MMRLTAPLVLGPLALALLCLAAAPALAEDGLPPTSQFFDEYDTNMDGKVLAAEFRGSSEVFKLLDKDGDGAIRPEELGLPADYKPAPGARKNRGRPEAPARGGPGAEQRAKQMEKFRKRVMAMDSDQDGRVSKAEWKGPEAAFARFDRNQDGFIDAQDAGGDRRGGKGGGKGRPRKGGAEKPPRAGRMDPEQMKARATGHFKSLDKNGDGKLTTDEAPNPKLIEMADADKDGAVTLEEFLGVMKKRARAGRGADGKGGRAGKGEKGGANRRRGRISAGMLRRWDRNQDGKVSPEEFPGQDAMFKRLDADKDGSLTEADIKAARKQRGEKGAGRNRGPDKPAAPAKQGNVIEQQDTDGDGKLNRAEFQGTNSVWRLLDRNGDGWITADELR